ncbi:ribosome small subunit-dependent GTPase A [Capillimicrobium parvum]|uniref:Small ribosomal subunit biogenesis GTPase RsgA n=1 Tax=Capillimicrobium parvum TaxID=2884022 RepID=A0A9E7BZE2_9ACTN|nr:ribosome small subunit-dependent GTPase A [Capillimicrobium parvum]UGS34469.1 Small ribosomal subunit biogenesis GTPase RsgA [Capillimicrobium parvum]
MHADLAGLGRRPDLTAELDALGDPSLTLARVLAQHRGRWLVATADRPHAAPARGRLRETPPVTGDWVALDRAGAIAAVLPRRGTITRRAAGTATAEQVLAANVDLALLAEPLPAPNARRAERFAALAAAGGVPAAVVLTKADLDEDAHLGAARLARRLGAVDGFAVSAPHGDGIAPLRALLEPGATAVLLGPSGAGKSTLVNALLGSDRQATGAVREGDGRGRHTTVARELIALPGGALVIDTPGLREVGLWEPASFADVDALAADCRFADCAHAGEPGCAVRDAVDDDRIESWRKLQREQAWIDDRRAASREREARGRARSRATRGVTYKRTG